MKKILSAIIVAMLLMTLTMSAFAATGLGSYTTVTVSPASPLPPLASNASDGACAHAGNTIQGKSRRTANRMYPIFFIGI